MPLKEEDQISFYVLYYYFVKKNQIRRILEALLSGGTQRRALFRHQSDEKEIYRI